MKVYKNKEGREFGLFYILFEVIKGFLNIFFSIGALILNTLFRMILLIVVAMVFSELFDFGSSRVLIDISNSIYTYICCFAWIMIPSIKYGVNLRNDKKLNKELELECIIEESDKYVINKKEIFIYREFHEFFGKVFEKDLIYAKLEYKFKLMGESKLLSGELIISLKSTETFRVSSVNKLTEILEKRGKTLKREKSKKTLKGVKKNE